MFNLKKKKKAKFSKEVVPFFIPTCSVHVPDAPRASNTGTVSRCNVSHSDRSLLQQWGPVAAICMSSIPNTYLSSLVKSLLKALDFLIKVLCFLTIEFGEFFMYFRYVSFLRYMTCTYFLPVLDLSFYYSLNSAF